MNRTHKTKTFIPLYLVICLLLAVSPLSASAAQDSSTFMVPANFSELAKVAKPSVVNVRTVTIVKGGGRVFRHFFGDQFDKKNNPFDEFWSPHMENGRICAADPL